MAVSVGVVGRLLVCDKSQSSRLAQRRRLLTTEFSWMALFLGR